MTIRYMQNVLYALGFSRNCGRRTLAIAVAIGFVLAAGPAPADGGDDDDDHDDGGFCSATTSAQFKACENEVRDDFFVAKAKCINVSDEMKRSFFRAP